MPDVTIKKYNETYMQILSDEPSLLADICERFSYEIPNKQYNPKVKYGGWDGVIRLYNMNTNLMYLGLHDMLLAFLKGRGTTYSTDIKKPSVKLSNDDISSLIQDTMVVSTSGVKIDPYPYQLDAIRHMINSKRSVVLAATSAGKSLILYLTIRIYQTFFDELEDKKIMVVVPSAGLVEQMYNDFEDYSKLDPSWDVGDECQKIAARYSKDITKNIIITTWQSASKFDHEYMNNILGAVFVDECHSCKGTVLKSMLEKLYSVSIRHGVTGTLDNVESNEMMIQGVLGPSKRIVSAIDLMKNGAATVVDIHQIMLEYPDDIKEALDAAKDELTEGTEKYALEMGFIETYAPRNEFIKNITESYEGNTLILYSHLAHGELIEQSLKDTVCINGDVKISEREDIRQMMETSDDINLVASYGTCSTGISIKKLHNLVLASPSKSVIRVLQSVGRMMRKHKTKDRSYIIDIVDNLGDECYSVRHAIERLKYYRNEQFNINYIVIKL